MNKQKTGIFSGSFNPIHIGHLALANYLCEYEGLDEIWFMVSPQNPLKAQEKLWNDELRLELVKLSISDYPRFQASDFEFHLPRPPQALLEGNVLFTDYKGAITEQYVLQQLKSVKGLNIYYWSSDTSKGELDFLLQKEIYIIPVEVKAEENLQSKSLRSFVEKNPGLHGIRFSMSDYRQQEWLTNYPLYSVGYIF